MKIELNERTEHHVRVYFEKAKDPEIRAVLPQSASTVEEALTGYYNSMKPDAASYGRTIYVDGTYVGDIWCYGIEQEDEPNAMVSYCIFEKSYWNRGVASEALKCFLVDIIKRFNLKSVGAFTYADNCASIGVLRKNGFQEQERFVEDGVESVYLQVEVP